jgi:hypothetical protein
MTLSQGGQSLDNRTGRLLAAGSREMDNTKMMAFNKELLTAMRAMFETSVTAMGAVQDQTFKMLEMLQQKNSDAGRSSNEAMDMWLGAWRKGQEELKHVVEQNFEKAEQYLDTMTKTK